MTTLQILVLSGLVGGVVAALLMTHAGRDHGHARPMDPFEKRVADDAYSRLVHRKEQWERADADRRARKE